MFYRLFFIFFLTGGISNAQKLKLIYDLENGFGFVDNNGDTIVKPKYQEASDFQNGFASVQMNDKWGFINSNGKETIECQYNSISEGFSKYGFARVYQIDFGYLYIDTLGQQCNFTRIYDTFKNRAVVDFVNGGLGIVDLLTREEIYKCTNCDGGLQFSKTGLVQLDYPNQTYIDFNGNEFFLSESSNQLESYKNELGKIGFYKYKLSSQSETHGLLLYTREVLPAKYDTIYQVAIHGDFGEEWSDLSSEGYSYVGINGKMGLVDTTGKEITPIIYDWIDHSFFGNENVKVSFNKKIGFINKLGNEVIKPIFSDAGNFSEGMVWVKTCPKCNFGFLNTKGEIVIDTTLNYLEVGDFSEELAFMKKEIEISDGVKNQLYGFIDKNGNEVITPKYDYAENFHNGLSMVGMNVFDEENGFFEISKFFIDKNGKEIK